MCKDSQFSFLPNPGIKPRSPALQVDSLPVEHKGSPRIVEWTAYPFSSRSSQPRNWTRDSCIAGRFFTNWAIRKAFSHSVVSNSLQPHGLEHARLPCLSPTPGACPNSCPLSRWYHPIISSPVVPFSSCLQHQGLFQGVNSSHQVAKVLELQLQH